MALVPKNGLGWYWLLPASLAQIECSMWEQPTEHLFVGLAKAMIPITLVEGMHLNFSFLQKDRVKRRRAVEACWNVGY